MSLNKSQTIGFSLDPEKGMFEENHLEH